jgi:hypothetical protein
MGKEGEEFALFLFAPTLYRRCDGLSIGGGFVRLARSAGARV